ncbi:hypothetical protein [Mycobacterium sp. IS-1742]|uniref:hypothetical protein n=1 Tax=Mycobacterium sp. IS-1742 TaxID=1772285 RepID=UPI000B26D427|nr:hypothetical protein [Mycobacterium sp. IS-1742]
MTAPSAEHGASFRAQTCIEPDRIAHLVRDVSEAVQGGFPRAFIRFEGAAPGRLSFSVRTRFTQAELMSFDVAIAELDDGFTSLSVDICDRLTHNKILPWLPLANWSLGHEIYKRYARELAGALARFDPMSTAVLLDRVARP